MSLRGRALDERYNLWVGDYLNCQGCGGLVYGPVGTWEYWRNIKAAYLAHAARCFALRRVLVSQRRAELVKKP